MYYVIKKEYVGPNQDQEKWVDYDIVVISRKPARTNMSHEIKIKGWCGTTNDLSVTAYGEYETLEQAENAILEKFGKVRIADSEYQDPNIVAAFKPGEYAPISRETASNIADQWCTGLCATSTDKKLDEILEEMEDYARGEGFTIAGWEDFIREKLEDHIEEIKENNI